MHHFHLNHQRRLFCSKGARSRMKRGNHFAFYYSTTRHIRIFTWGSTRVIMAWFSYIASLLQMWTTELPLIFALKDVVQHTESCYERIQVAFGAASFAHTRAPPSTAILCQMRINRPRPEFYRLHSIPIATCGLVGQASWARRLITGIWLDEDNDDGKNKFVREKKTIQPCSHESCKMSVIWRSTNTCPPNTQNTSPQKYVQTRERLVKTASSHKKTTSSIKAAMSFA